MGSKSLKVFYETLIIRYNDNDKNDSTIKNGLSCTNRAQLLEYGTKCKCERDEWHQNI